jgi:chromosome segregation ATPase
MTELTARKNDLMNIHKSLMNLEGDEKKGDEKKAEPTKTPEELKKELEAAEKAVTDADAAVKAADEAVVTGEKALADNKDDAKETSKLLLKLSRRLKQPPSRPKRRLSKLLPN